MKILLVNSNPVVSRLTALSARKESVELDEIKDISELKKSDYNIVFVDSEAFSVELSTVLKNSDIKRKVLFYTQDDDKEKDKIFNFTILKPFLPSEVSAILREAKIEIDEEESLSLSEKSVEPKEEYLDLKELISTKRDDLATITTTEKVPTIEKIKKVKKVELVEEIKESCNDLKETEEKLLEELNASKSRIDDIKNSFDLGLEKKFIPNKEEKKDDFESNELFEIDNIKDIGKNSNNNSDLFVEDIKHEDTKNEDINELLTLDVDSKNEVDFKNIKKAKKIESKKIENKKEIVETKILDKDEISNIKSLLNDEVIDDNLSLEDVMTMPPPTISYPEPKVDEIKTKNEKEKISKESENEKEIRKEIKKEKECAETPKVVKRVFKDTVGSLPIEELRQLLRGTKIHITIEFPKEV